MNRILRVLKSIRLCMLESVGDFHQSPTPIYQLIDTHSNLIIIFENVESANLKTGVLSTSYKIAAGLHLHESQSIGKILDFPIGRSAPLCTIRDKNKTYMYCHH